MIRKLILAILTAVLFLLLSVPVLAESTSSIKYDDRKDIGLKSQPSSPTSVEMHNNLPAVNPHNSDMINPADSIEVNSNTPSSAEIPPSISGPSMHSGSPSSPGLTSGQ